MIYTKFFMQYTFYFGMKHILYKSKEVYVAPKKEVYGLRKVVYTYRMAICTIFCVSLKLKKAYDIYDLQDINMLQTVVCLLLHN